MSEVDPSISEECGAVSPLSKLRLGPPRFLSAAQVEGYDRNGFVLPALRALSAEEALGMRAELEKAEAAEGKPAGMALRHGHARYPWLADLVSSPAIVDAVQDLIGPNVMVWSISVFVKEPGTVAYIGWHQDCNYWGLTPLDGIVTAWVALSDVDAESGPMEFLRGSHVKEPQPQEDTYNPDNLLSRGQEIRWTEPIDPAQVVRATMLAGEFSLHHIKIAHASGPNSGTDRRLGVAIRYMPTCTRSERDHETAMLVRGEDAFGHFIIESRPVGAHDPRTIAQWERACEIKWRNTMLGSDPRKVAKKQRKVAKKQRTSSTPAV